MEETLTEKAKKVGRKPLYKEERVKLSFRCSKRFSDDLNTIYELKKKKDKELTYNDFVLGILKDKIDFEIYQLRKTK